MTFVPFPLPFVSKYRNTTATKQALVLLFIKSCFVESYHLASHF